MAIAAAIVVVLGAGYFGLGLINHEREFRALEDAHFEIAENLSDLPNAYLAAAQVSSTIGYELAPAVAGFDLVGGHTDEVDGIEMYHFVYRNHERLVSVFVAEADKITIPESILETPVMKNHIQFFLHHCRGCNLAYHKVGNAIVVTATEDHDVELLEFIPGQGTI